MKTTISIPNAVFQAAEALARRLGVSRSELFSRASIEAHKQDSAKEALDKV